jgi:GNAT superfamily N-acetyltransferase
VRKLAVRPVTPESWADFARLFAARGSPHYCWCTPYRLRGAHRMSAAEKQASMKRAVAGNTPIGVLAYDGDEPIGWCSIAPRQTYAKLERSRTMPRVTPLETSTWTVLCFFVARRYRGQGVSRALLRGAVAHARAQRAAVIEAYPFDSAGVTATHRGHSSLFASAGFRQDGKRWFFEVARRSAKRA